jgi:hypothetical protein
VTVPEPQLITQFCRVVAVHRSRQDAPGAQVIEHAVVELHVTMHVPPVQLNPPAGASTHVHEPPLAQTQVVPGPLAPASEKRESKFSAHPTATSMSTMTPTNQCFGVTRATSFTPR